MGGLFGPPLLSTFTLRSREGALRACGGSSFL